MPAVTPAEVATFPSRTKIGSGSTVTPGYRWASLAQLAQCVVTRARPSSPASASTNVPVHTDTIRSASGACVRSQPISSGAGARLPGPPGTITVCGVSSSARSASGTMVSPLPVRTVTPPTLAVRICRYRPPGVGPHLAGDHAAGGGEHLQRPGHVQALHLVEQGDQHTAGSHTLGSHIPMLRPAPHDRNDENPTFPAMIIF